MEQKIDLILRSTIPFPRRIFDQGITRFSILLTGKVSNEFAALSKQFPELNGTGSGD